jgi:hypothetical protein
MARDAGTTYDMIPEVAEYSFLNRWFIFKRKNDFKMAEEDEKNLYGKEGAEEVDEEEEEVVAPVKTLSAAATEFKPQGIPFGFPGVVPKLPLGFVPPLPAGPPPPPLPPGPPPPLPGAPVVARKPSSKAKAKAPRGGGEMAPEVEEQREFDLTDLYQFHIDAPLVDKLKLGDTSAARWLAPISRFPIFDGEDEYPSLEHYIAAMKYKYGTEKPQLAKGLFGKNGTVHQQALRFESVQLGDREPNEEDSAKFLADEMASIQKQLKPAGFKANKVTFNEGNWLAKRDEVLRNGLEQRWNKDARFRRILEAIRNQGKYLLYYTGATGTSDLGGIRRANKKIDGNNRLGQLMMEIAGFPNA